MNTQQRADDIPEFQPVQPISGNEPDIDSGSPSLRIRTSSRVRRFAALGMAALVLGVPGGAAIGATVGAVVGAGSGADPVLSSVVGSVAGAGNPASPQQVQSTTWHAPQSGEHDAGD